jgi:integrase/recombinase XerD
MKRLALAAAVAFYLQSRRRLGFALESSGALLGNLVHYGQQVHHRGPLTTQLALDWAQAPASGSLSRARRLEAVRQFALFWVVFDPRTQVPPAGLFGPAHRRQPVHIYTPAEITALLSAAQTVSWADGQPLQYLRPLLGLLACTGLRISEALALRLSDWDPQAAVLTIRQSKFGQSRYVPLSPTAADALKGYLQARGGAFPKAQSDALFLNKHGRSLAYGRVNRAFGALRQQLGWRQQPRPRLHDLRHTFAVNCLLGWYCTGEQELNARILSLAVYLGHRSIRHTYWYLSAVPELLALASARWDKASTTRKGVPHE